MNQIETGVDRLVKLVNSEKKISVENAAKKLGISKIVVQEWVGFLEEEKLISIDYKFSKMMLIERKLTDVEVKEKKNKDGDILIVVFKGVNSVDKAINNPLLDVDISGASGALINVSGGPDMTLDEARKVVETISQKLDEDAKIIWGAQISKDLESTLRVMLIVVGVNSSQIFGNKVRKSTTNKHDMEKELGIDFIE